MNKFTVADSVFNYNILEGRVTSTNEKFETIFTGTGGGGSVVNGQGQIAPVKITSHSVKHTDIYLENAHGVPFHVKLYGWDIPCTKNHLMRFLYLEKEGASYSDYAAIRNITLNQEWLSDNLIENLYGSGNIGCLKTLLILFITVNLAGAAFFVLALIFPFLQILGFASGLGAIFGMVIGIIIISKRNTQSKRNLSVKKMELRKKIESLI